MHHVYNAMCVQTCEPVISRATPVPAHHIHYILLIYIANLAVVLTLQFVEAEVCQYVGKKKGKMEVQMHNPAESETRLLAVTTPELLC